MEEAYVIKNRSATGIDKTWNTAAAMSNFAAFRRFSCARRSR